MCESQYKQNHSYKYVCYSDDPGEFHTTISVSLHTDDYPMTTEILFEVHREALDR